MSCFCRTEILGTVCANSGIIKSGIRALDCNLKQQSIYYLGIDSTMVAVTHAPERKRAVDRIQVAPSRDSRLGGVRRLTFATTEWVVFVVIISAKMIWKYKV